MSIRIKSVDPDGLGAYLGLKPGDRLLKINQRKVQDHLDYQYRIAVTSPELELEIDGSRQVVAVDKEEDTDLGVTFEDFAIRSCANDCVFCFVDQNPAGLRAGLYFRDGDYRLSFLYGHYITLTNMGTKELQRIVEQRLSPLYVSIHATDPALRRELLLYGKDDKLLDKLSYLTAQGIVLHGQIVLCPGLNDGEQLRRTLDDLLPLIPGLRSLAIVPVGLTAHRAGLQEIPTVSPDYAREFIAIYSELDRRYRLAGGGRWLLLSDEWYILANQAVPSASYYEGLAMEANGVGQVRAFLDRFVAEQPQFPRALPSPTRITLATGVLAASVFTKYILPGLDTIGNLRVELQVIPNTLFGAPVTVAGLLSGRDFIARLEGRDLGDGVYTTQRILNDAGELTLDDMTLPQISQRLGVPFRVSSDSFLDLFNGLADG